MHWAGCCLCFSLPGRKRRGQVQAHGGSRCSIDCWVVVFFFALAAVGSDFHLNTHTHRHTRGDDTRTKMKTQEENRHTAQRKTKIIIGNKEKPNRGDTTEHRAGRSDSCLSASFCLGRIRLGTVVFFLLFLFFLSLRSSASENSPLEKRKAIVQISSVQRDNVLKSYIIWWWLFNLISADDDNRLHFFFSSMTNEIWSGMDYGTLLLLLHQQQTKHHVQHQHTKRETFVFFIFLNYAVIWRGWGWSC